MKTYQINGTEISCSHEIKIDEKTHHVSILCKFSHECGKSLEHVLTVGAENVPPVGLTKESLQAAVDDFKQRHAEIFAGKLQAKELADSLTD